MTKEIEKNAIDITMEDIFCNPNLLIRIIAAGGMNAGDLLRAERMTAQCQE